MVEVQINGAPEIGREVLTDFLGDAELKSIMSDGYNAYVFSKQSKIGY